MSNPFNYLPKPNRGIIGHRGIAGMAPENTLAGFLKASELGITWVEFDIQRCASGEWILMHDKSLNRTTNGHGNVSEVSYKVIKTLDAGSWFHPTFHQERIPLLQDALACLIDLHIHPNIEIKGFTTNKKYAAQNFLAELAEVWPSSYSPPLVSSFDLELLILLRRLNNSLPLGYVIKQHPERGVKEVLRHKLNTLHCHHMAFPTPALLDRTLQQLPLLIYTVNDLDRIQHYLNAGASAVFSDLTHIAVSLSRH